VPACPQLELQRVRSQLGLAQTEKELLQAELAKQSGEASSSALKLGAASREAGQLAALQPRVEELQQEVRSLAAQLEASRKEVSRCWP
jgi:chromosome segregation ATPase